MGLNKELPAAPPPDKNGISKMLTPQRLAQPCLTLFTIDKK